MSDARITFEDIVDLWATNSPLVMFNAYRQSIRQDPDSPEAIKDQLCGAGEGDSGLIHRTWRLLQDTMGRLDLAYKRGEQRENIVL